MSDGTRTRDRLDHNQELYLLSYAHHVPPSATSQRLPSEAMTDLGIDGFEYADVGVGDSTYRLGVAGDGPAVLLLHGFPQYHYCWHAVGPALAGEHTVVVCDLKGCGEGRAPQGGPLGEGYSKREIAAEIVEAMRSAGFARFAVVGHDRGGRVAYRMALDHPGDVTRLAVLNIVPTSDQFERMAEAVALDYYPWYLLAQPAPLPERLLGGSAEYFIRHVMESWTADSAAIDDRAVDRYVRAFTPDAIAAWCSEYRAAFHTDRQLDAEDRAAGRAIDCPVLVHWGAADEGMSNGPLAVWRRWADRVEGGALRSGHFIPEEAAGALGESLRRFLA